MARTRDPKRVFGILGKAFGAVGLVGLLVAGVFWFLRSSSLKKMRHIDGTVVANVTGQRGVPRPVIQFTPPGRSSVRFTSPIGSTVDVYRVGQNVPLFYSPADPRDAVMDAYWHLWFFPTLFGMLGGVFALLGIGFSITHLAIRRSR